MIKKIKHLFEYIIFIALTSFLRVLSVDKAASLCSMLARKIGPYLGVSNIARSNLQKVYGNDINIEKTIDELWDNYGRYIGEFAFINSMSDEELLKRVKLTGLENVKKFQEQGRPFMLFLGHQANWDFVIRRINDIYPKFGIVYRKANNPYVDRCILGERSSDSNIIMIPKGPSGVKDLMRAIKSKMSIAMLVDQKMNDGIEVPFFNKPAMTAPAIAKLSLRYNYPIIPCQIIRLKGSYFELKLHPELKYKATKNTEQDYYNIMLAINKKLEEWIRKKPGQWFWFHNRWK
ncbi:MAG: lipid A biosynthesis lauroyl acyltransferase [Rickettsiaceae bacterium]|nr:lipid A biosynthesis lauroyl acyltransferase [Rickettsiaceae bacterium]MDP4833046.1 lipid A biosynthesis lauroyl acyltransferase [Rickettsiaceae bacterium]MDP5021002.1 lipid A biosynthesis lauroyl acyltransferase [Rickettsiaceae bacterium]MDP5082671.1 lipid A biosynthesis lauroyl acyltransferase [Rickettsiaceae bacterium]